jgi:YL1 nuclear protein C-terminal domain/YL1 nuclear protein
MYTQDELISYALDNEEGNIVDHRDYLKLEEEKRKRARVVRATIDGPLLRWISKGEDVKVAVEPTPPPPPQVATFSYTYGSQMFLSNTQTPAIGSIPNVNPPSVSQPASSTSVSAPPPPPPPPPPIERTERVTQNYVVHELGQFANVSKPTWGDTMEAMFGDHVQWEDLRIFVGKNRPLSSFSLLPLLPLLPSFLLANPPYNPTTFYHYHYHYHNHTYQLRLALLARPRQMCPITGLQAPYVDPRTGVPFANLHAYDTITRILEHGYVWSDTLGCYIAQNENDDHSTITKR